MPIKLPPISRRRFLNRTLAAAASLALGEGCASIHRQTEQDQWALLSDTHIAADPLRISREINMTDNLKIVCQEVLAWRDRPPPILISGDLAFDGGESADYGALTQLLGPMRQGGSEIHLTLGNHDNRERFWAVLSRFKTVPRELPDRQAAIIKTHYANWFVLDSLIKTRTTPGFLGEAQRAWLIQALDANADKPALVVTHHNPDPGNGGANALEDTRQLLAILRPRRHVKAYFYGHTHRWTVGHDPDGLHFINLPPTAYVFEKGQPSGWVRATLRSDGIGLELRCLDKNHQNHGQTLDLAWRV
jgi:3',5'-cyclic-AMP phosphodiesterase